MSLNWNTTEIPEAVTHWPREDEETQGAYQSPVTYALIWAMLGLGLDGMITAKNVEEAVVQVMALQLRDGPLVQGGLNSAPMIYITPADVRAHVGLWTNVWGPNYGSGPFWAQSPVTRAEAEALVAKLADVPPLHLTRVPDPRQVFIPTTKEAPMRDNHSHN